MLKINAFCPKMLTFYAYFHRKKIKNFLQIEGKISLDMVIIIWNWVLVSKCKHRQRVF